MKLYLVEVGARNFVRDSMTYVLKDLGLCRARMRKAAREVSQEAGKASFWLWLRR